MINKNYSCTQCGSEYEIKHGSKDKIKYCPSCGNYSLEEE